MDINYEYNIINQKDQLFLYKTTESIIYNLFNKLNKQHQKLLIKYLFKLIMIFTVYFNDENIVKQLCINNYQDIYSLLILLLPYYDINLSKNITSLDELFLNKNNKANSFESSYYIDHYDLKDNQNYLNEYFDSCLKAINDTLSQVNTKLLPNWLNIFPYTMLNYKQSNAYKNLLSKFIKGTFTNYDIVFWNVNIDSFSFKNNYFINNEFFILGYNNLYGTIYNFLYMDIKDIKWMIFDVNVNNIIVPNILVISQYLNISNIYHIPWNKLENKSFIVNNFINLFNNVNNNNNFKSLILFYLRWERDVQFIKLIQNIKECDFIINNLQNLYEDNIDDEDKEDKLIYDDEQINRCILKIIPFIKVERLYTYIYECIHKFNFTWYGYYCLSDEKNILSYDDFFNKYFASNDVIFNNENQMYFYITPKNFYNYFKSLIHHTVDNKYVPLGNTHKWDNLSTNCKKIFINRINSDKMYEWFNIKRNLTRTFNNPNLARKYNSSIINKITKKKIIPTIIFETLVYNGLLSYFVFNNKLTNSTIIPNKNKDFKNWKKYIIKNLSILPYNDSYHWISNTKMSVYGDKMINSIIDSLWMTNFGGDWIFQIQMFHRYLHQRVIFITGATGAGKSSIAPFVILYGVKSLKFNNNAKVACTQPRIQPVTNNASNISKNIGMPYEETRRNINYIQYRYAEKEIYDEYYHPALTFYTDGLLYNIIINKYIYKKTVNFTENNITISKILNKNIFDVVLIDEAHEHNKYMDLILTLSKFALYINNQVTLGIISATMDTDEIIYRKFFEPIDDNWIAPVNINYITNPKGNFNSQFIDRRIHLSVPFGGTNYEIKEFEYDAKSIDSTILNNKVLFILNKIINNSSSGDILIFEPSVKDIEFMVKEINKMTPDNIIAIPFYKDIKQDILENIVKKIDDPRVRKTIRYPKKKYSINDVLDKHDDDLPENSYNRFIIVATNIAEASITLDTLEYVIDTGNQRINIYDYETDTEKIETKIIAIPNQKQRRGRVGRVKPGSVYYVYDRSKLPLKVFYKIGIENLTNEIILLITQTDSFFINSDNDPYKANDIDILPEILKNQYSYLDDTNIKQIYSYDKYNNIPCKKNVSDIVYPHIDGKYNIDDLIDNKGIFYIIHPNEDDFIREINITDSINKGLAIVETLESYKNKIELIIKNLKNDNIINENDKFSSYGNLFVNIYTMFRNYIDNINYIKIILDIMSFNLSIDSPIIKNLILFIIQNSTDITFLLNKGITGKADFLIKTSFIPNDLFNKIDFSKIDKNIINDIKNNEYKIIDNFFDKEVKNILIKKFNINIDKFKKYKFVYLIPDIIKNNLFQIITILKLFYIIKYFIYSTINGYFDEINLNDNKKYNKEIFNEFLNLNDYDKTTLILGKNLYNNILIKIFDTKYYINYNNKNYIYKLESFDIIIKNKLNTITKTMVLPIYRNYYVLSNKINDEFKISEITMITENIIKIIKKYFYKNNSLQKNIVNKKLYVGDNDIMLNMNKIINFINSSIS
jgi:hypothetical protein